MKQGKTNLAIYVNDNTTNVYRILIKFYGIFLIGVYSQT